MRYCGIWNQNELGAVTFREYKEMMDAVMLKKVDEEYQIHLLAWKNREVQFVKRGSKKNEPYFDKFDKFYSYEDRLRTALGLEVEESTPDDDIKDFLELINKLNGEEEQDE